MQQPVHTRPVKSVIRFDMRSEGLPGVINPSPSWARIMGTPPEGKSYHRISRYVIDIPYVT